MAPLPPVPAYRDTWPASPPCAIPYRPAAPDPRAARAAEAASATVVRIALARAFVRRPRCALIPLLCEAISAEYALRRAAREDA